MLARRKKPIALHGGAGVVDVVRTQASELTAARAKDPLYQL